MHALALRGYLVALTKSIPRKFVVNKISRLKLKLGIFPQHLKTSVIYAVCVITPPMHACIAGVINKLVAILCTDFWPTWYTQYKTKVHFVENRPL